MADYKTEVTQEVAQMSRYLLGLSSRAKISREFVERYERALILNPSLEFNSFEERLWSLALRSSVWMKFIDSGVAVKSPHSAIRQRLILMAAILEASPKHCDRFLPKAYSWSDAPLLSLSLASSVADMIFSAAVGFVVVTAMQLLELIMKH